MNEVKLPRCWRNSGKNQGVILTRRMSQSEVIGLVDTLLGPLGESRVSELQRGTGNERQKWKKRWATAPVSENTSRSLLTTSSLSSFSKKIVKTLSVYFPLTKDLPLQRGEAAWTEAETSRRAAGNKVWRLNILETRMLGWETLGEEERLTNHWEGLRYKCFLKREKVSANVALGLLPDLRPTAAPKLLWLERS